MKGKNLSNFLNKMGENGEGHGTNIEDGKLKAAIIVKELGDKPELAEKVLRARKLPNMERQEAEDILAQRDRKISQGKI